MGGDKEALLTPMAARNPTPYLQSLSPYCSSPLEAFAPSLPRPEILSLPGTDYSVMGQGDSFLAAAGTTSGSPQDFYTCVQLMHESGEVHLVPCLPPPYCREFPSLQSGCGDDAETEEKTRKLAEYQARKKMMSEPEDGGKAESSEASMPLLPVAVDNRG
ncbi:unnamed protein product [Pleuronectes platessa]|uniref:Uncharacterized protein n=1 Tax=Pleuronectes platessa TaxID=8262 RepID=A0A9N7ZEQ3_PLEPL|nr:unnamed protein product [Pleuronectes platessa]